DGARRAKRQSRQPQGRGARAAGRGDGPAAEQHADPPVERRVADRVGGRRAL
ncbi:hypothetical protein BN1708_018959, partial [Verticillium longisporum]